MFFKGYVRLKHNPVPVFLGRQCLEPRFSKEMLNEPLVCESSTMQWVEKPKYLLLTSPLAQSDSILQVHGGSLHVSDWEFRKGSQ